MDINGMAKSVNETNRFVPTTCFECRATLTKEEIKQFWEGPRCCEGYNCGCGGMPTQAPYCFKCTGGN